MSLHASRAGFVLPRLSLWWRCLAVAACGRNGDGAADDAAPPRASGRHGGDGDAARAGRAHSHDRDERLRLRLAGRRHRVRGRRLSRRRRVRRRRRSREEGPAAGRLSTALLQAEVASKQAALKQRKAELTNAQAALERGQSLGDDEPAVEGGSRSAALRAAGGAVAPRVRARRSRDFAAAPASSRDVSAPDDGVITSRTVTVGQIAQAGNEMLRMLRNGRIEWRGEAPETRLKDLAPGQGVSVMTADGTPSTARCASSRRRSPRTTHGLVYVDLPADDRLRPGMFARGEIAIGTGPAYMVPLESIVSSDGYSYVFVSPRTTSSRAGASRPAPSTRRPSKSSPASRPASASSTKAPAS